MTSRLPIRLRLTLAFSGSVAVILTLFGALLYTQTRGQLDESLDDNLELRLADAASIAARPNADGYELAFDPEDTFTQIVTAANRQLVTSSAISDEAVLSRDELDRARQGQSYYERDSIPGMDGRIRILAGPSPKRDGAVAIVGATLEDRDESLRNLLLLLLIGGPSAMGLATLGGYWVAGRALAPVESMRRQATAISGAPGGERLAIPPARDELSRLATTLNGMLARLEAGIERERRFVDDASHELRTPLALHKTELEIALRYADDEQQLRDAIAKGITEVDRLTKLANDLLVVAREGRPTLADTEDLDLNELLAGVRSRFTARAEEEGRRITLAGGEAPPVRGSRPRLEQAVTNLVDNALRHGKGEVELAVEPRGRAVRLIVRDRGSGIPSGFRTHAFERFTQADRARTGSGSGLGLAIVAAIAEDHGGAVGIADRTGGGAEIWMEVPRTDGGFHAGFTART